MPYGTLQILDTLAANRTLIAQYGEDNAYAAIQKYLDAHNQIMESMLADLAEPTTDRLRRYGGVDSMVMIEGDEYSRPDVQKLLPGVNVGFPLKLYQVGLQWTRKYFETHTVAELAGQVTAAMTADVRNVQSQLKRALFTPTNNTGYLDRLVDNLNVPVRALLNADGTQIPADPWGNTFNANTHTHYLGLASGTTPTAADVTTLINTVLEHYNMGDVVVYINQASEAAFRGFTGFNAILDARIVPAYTSQYATGELDIMNVYNRKIGLFGPAEVWVKPWVPANYAFAFNPTQRKPLALRTRDSGAGNLRIAAELDAYPLHAQFMEREFGLGCQERTNGACLLLNNVTYSAPTSF